MNRYTLFAVLLLLILFACNDDSPSLLVTEIDVETPDLKITRLDAILANSTEETVLENVNNFQESHPELSSIYFEQIMRIKRQNADFDSELKAFISNEQIKSLLDTVQQIYPSLNDFLPKLTDACRFYKHYFPDEEIPSFYTMITEFSLQNFIFESNGNNAVGIGLDMFLGDEFNYKMLDPKNPSFSDYLSKYYNKESIARKSMRVLIEDKLVQQVPNNFLDYIINEGKILYILRRLFPKSEPNYFIEYSKDEFNWCLNNELEIWDFFNEKNLIFDSSVRNFMKYINPSPNSPGMPNAAPGKTGAFIGWKIVESYMRNNKDLSFSQLIDIKDSELLLANYKPRRK